MQLCLATPSQPLGRKGKHACFSKADAKIEHFFHICKYFAKKACFLSKIGDLCHAKIANEGDMWSKIIEKETKDKRQKTKAGDGFFRSTIKDY